MKSTAVVLALVVPLYAAGCAMFQGRDSTRGIQDGAQIGCIIANAFLPNETAIARACSLTPAFFDLIRQVAGAHRLGVQRELSIAGVSRKVEPFPGYDGGAP